MLSHDIIQMIAFFYRVTICLEKIWETKVLLSMWNWQGKIFILFFALNLALNQNEYPRLS